MKKNTVTQKQTPGNRKRPENKDKLDPRGDEEESFKGDDVTHNRKAVKKKKSIPKRQGGSDF